MTERNRASARTNKGYAEIELTLSKNNSKKRTILKVNIETPSRTWSRQRTLGDTGEMDLTDNAREVRSTATILLETER